MNPIGKNLVVVAFTTDHADVSDELRQAMLDLMPGDVGDNSRGVVAWYKVDELTPENREWARQNLGLDLDKPKPVSAA